jgi:hypothetical protein
MWGRAGLAFLHGCLPHSVSLSQQVFANAAQDFAKKSGEYAPNRACDVAISRPNLRMRLCT